MPELKPGGWLKKSSKEGGEAYCKVCHQELKNHLDTLKKHNKSQKHKNIMQQQAIQRSVSMYMVKPSGKFLVYLTHVRYTNQFPSVNS